MKRNHSKTAERENTVQDYQALKKLGEHYISIGDYAQAQQCYEKCAVLNPDEAEPYVGLGIISLQRNLLDDAEISFRVACRLDPNCARGYGGLAVVAQRNADYAKAFDMYLKCLELDAENLAALLGLFQASCRMGSFAKVIHYLELYLGSHPQDTSVMFSLAALYIKENRMAQARKVLLDVLTLDADNKDATNLLEEIDHNLAGAAHSEV